jgi:hypothetical protein
MPTFPYPNQRFTSNLGLSLFGMDEVLADNMNLIDAAIGGGGGGGTPGGANGTVQFNNAGVFGGIPGSVVDGVNGLLSLAPTGTGTALSVTGDSSGLYIQEWFQHGQTTPGTLIFPNGGDSVATFLYLQDSTLANHAQLDPISGLNLTNTSSGFSFDLNTSSGQLNATVNSITFQAQSATPLGFASFRIYGDPGGDPVIALYPNGPTASFVIDHSGQVNIYPVPTASTGIAALKVTGDIYGDDIQDWYVNDVPPRIQGPYLAVQVFFDGTFKIAPAPVTPISGNAALTVVGDATAKDILQLYINGNGTKQAYFDSNANFHLTGKFYDGSGAPGTSGQLLSSTGTSTAWVPAPTGTVTSFSAGALNPLFTTSVATATTTPALSFSLSNAAGGTVFGNATASAAAPGYTIAPVLGIPGTSTGTIALASSTASGKFTITAPASAATPTLTLSTSSGVIVNVADGTVFTATIAANGTLALATQTANTVFAGPSSAGPTAPTFRALVAADIPNTTITPIWNNLQNATGNLTLANGANTTTFNQTSNVAWLWANTTIATSGTTNASPLLELAANYWTGAASAVDTWTIGSALAAGTNGASILTLAHSGSTSANSAVQIGNATSNGKLIFSTSLGSVSNYIESTSSQIFQFNCTNDMLFFVGGTRFFRVEDGNTGAMGMIPGLGTSAANPVLYFSTNSVTQRDTGISRLGVAILGVGNGNTAGDWSGILQASGHTGSSVVLSLLSSVGVVTVTPTLGSASTWTYVVVAKDANGFVTAASAAASTTTGAATLDATHFNTLTWTAIPGAASYDVYRTVHATSPTTIGKIGNVISSVNVATTGFKDNGLAGDATTAPAVNTTGTISIAGNITTYKGINTVSNGVPSELAVSDLTAQSAAIAATTLYATTATGMYRVSWSATITTVDGVSSVLGGAGGFQVLYTSPTDSVVKTTVSGNSVTSAANTTGTAVGGCEVVYAKTGTNIQFQYGYTSATPGQMIYELHIKVEAM